MKHIGIIILTPFVISSFIGCTSVTPRENFIDIRNADIGGYINPAWFHDRRMTGPQKLSNGNLEYKFDYSFPRQGPCIYYKEVDHKTSRIVAWRTEGDDSGCLIVP